MKLHRVLFLLLISLSLAGCASVSMVSSWKDQGAPVKSYRDFLVVGITEKPQMRQVFEEVLAGELRKKGVSATASYTMTGVEQQLSRESIEKAAQASAVDAVITARLVDMKRKTATSAGYEMTERGHSIAGLDSSGGGTVDLYGISGAGAVSYASFSMKSVEITTSKTAVIETKLYDTTTKNLVWSGISNALNPAGLITVTGEFAGVVITSLSKEGLIR